MEDKKVYLDWQEIERHTLTVIWKILRDQWRPDYVVGLTRGGLLPATLISQFMGVPMHALKISLRDADCNGTESNLWMSEDAFGYVGYGSNSSDTAKATSRPEHRKNILVVDDINDSGATLDWLVKDWQSSYLPNDPCWSEIWHRNVKFATLIDNAGSNFTVDYAAKEIDKVKEPCWIVFPWENWWEAKNP